jgi:hypothetical protein
MIKLSGQHAQKNTAAVELHALNMVITETGAELLLRKHYPH